MPIESYRDLRVWREAMDLVEVCYRLTAQFPRDEIYGLVSQIRRAATAIPANIAEGCGRDPTGSCIRFFKISRGSLKEHEAHILVAARVEIVTSEAIKPTLERCETVGKMLNGLIRSLKEQTL